MIIEGILSVFSLHTILLIFGGTVLGILFGSIPGITVTMGVALFLPVTFSMAPIDGLSLLMGLYIGGTSGGLISAILLNIPGTPASICTCFDGCPLAQNGQAGKALGIGIVFSFLGGMFSLLVLYFISPLVAEVALNFGSYEYFSIGVFSLTLVSTMSGESLAKGIFSALLGFTFTFVGMAPITAFPRFTFGIRALNGGISLLPALIGLFAVSQLFEASETPYQQLEHLKAPRIKGFGFSRSEFFSQKLNFLRSALIGTGIGILPGLGGAICSVVSYGVAKNQSKTPELFGNGSIEGLAASETANNASTGGALVPLMTLGIPGDNTTAILLAGFMIHGITPGPLLFENNGVLVYGIFTALLIANLFMLISEFGGMRLFVRILAVPKHILLPIVLTLCVFGSYGLNNRMFDVWTMLFFGILGYILKKFSVPSTPLLLGFILGPIIETELRRGLMRSQGSFLPFFTEPISGFILILTIIIVLYSTIRTLHRQHRSA
ncbi:tripartite tricarboxylate transporter permease [Sphaerochaeta sp.]|jgi:putative tricarboxylic transport membrane protein|uniref:tripartite tricarboxylate transporter permease n=1 Tax=Sphaerochaeta sp. TaxID=1972642 RepID=UPI002FC966D2